MSASVEAVCIDPDRAGEVWPHAVSFIANAVKRCNLNNLDDVQSAVLSGRALLWLGWDGNDIVGAMVTTIATVATGKVCMITAFGGDHRRCATLLSIIESYAKSEGCGVVRLFGRKGWTRRLPAYRARHVILERTI